LNQEQRPGYFRIVFDCRDIADAAVPGQFCMLKVADKGEILLRRPLSVHRIENGKLEFLYELIGKGTRELSRRRPGEGLDLLGPLGNGFDYSSDEYAAKKPILVAGGMGAAPLVFLAEKLRERKNKGSKSKTLVLIGAKTKSHILCEKEFKNYGCDVKIATDNGSAGSRGRVTALLEGILSEEETGQAVIYGCGPNPMLKELSRISNEIGVPAQLSLEAHMACGIGACLGCAVRTKEGYQRVCKEGPVFDARKMIF